jgi:uncharacterized repeat protein (TIGR03803 family)
METDPANVLAHLQFREYSVLPLLSFGTKLIFPCGLALALALSSDVAAAGQFEVLHEFAGGSDGQSPQAGLTEDQTGSLYGTTFGAETGAPGKHCSKNCGNVYAILHGGGEQTIYSFDGSDGAGPTAPLLASGGNLYGTTSFGYRKARFGTLFKLTPDGKETVLYTFCSLGSCADGRDPIGGVAIDDSGSLYGTTFAGGVSANCSRKEGCGTVYKLSPNGDETVLYSFCAQPNCTDGDGPAGSVLLDKAGNLYGTTSFGGAQGHGALWKLAANGTETAIYSFCSQPSCTDGAGPSHTNLIVDHAGNFYGTTAIGGGFNSGTVWRLAPNGTESVLYSFCQLPDGLNCKDGDFPEAGVIADAEGNLYGTTYFGGLVGGSCGYSIGCGTVFKLAPDGTETVLHAFCSSGGCSDGSTPQSSLVLDGKHLFGNTTYGGLESCNSGIGCGTLFKVKK